MTRLPRVQHEQLQSDARAILEGAVRLELYERLAHASTAFVPWVTLSATLLGGTTLHPVLRELAILRVAHLTPGGAYERAQHEPVALTLGAEPGDVAAACGEAEPREPIRRLLSFVDRLLDNSARPDDADWDFVLHRVGSRQIVELVLVVTQYAALARTIAALDLDPEPASPALVAMAEFQRSEREPLDGW